MKYVIFAALLTACASEKPKFSPDAERAIQAANFVDVTSCQQDCFIKTHKYFEQDSIFNAYYPKDVDVVVQTVQKCSLKCFAKKDKWDEISDELIAGGNQ